MFSPKPSCAPQLIGATKPCTQRPKTVAKAGSASQWRNQTYPV